MGFLHGARPQTWAMSPDIKEQEQRCSRLMPSVLASLQLRSCKPQMSATSAAPFLHVPAPKNPLVVCGHSGFIQRQDFSGTHSPLVPPAPRSLLCAPAFYFHFIFLRFPSLIQLHGDEITEQGTGDAEEPGGSYRVWLPTAVKSTFILTFPIFLGRGKWWDWTMGWILQCPTAFPGLPPPCAAFHQQITHPALF